MWYDEKEERGILAEIREKQRYWKNVKETSAKG